MRQIREILRLCWDRKRSQREVARLCGISHSTVKEALRRAEEAGLAWPLPEDWDDAVLEAKRYPPAPTTRRSSKALPDMTYIHRELRRKGVTLQLLWEEFVEENPEGLRYSQFCERYRQWCKKLRLSMRQVHVAGEKLFVDFAGPTIPVVHLADGSVRLAKLFVACLGASGYTYARAVWSEQLQDWLLAHCDAFEFFGGVTEVVVSDQLKAAVTKPCRYEPDIHRAYADLAAHYGTVILPARPLKPKDKAKVEAGVLLAERWILARLRRHTFHSLAEVNEAIATLLDRLNDKPFQKMDGCRRSLYEALDKPALGILPATRFVYAEWFQVRANIDYHVEVKYNFYSVPYQLRKEKLDVRLSQGTVEILHKGRRVASHIRQIGKGRYSTQKEHMPDSHRRHAEWTPSRLVRWGASVGPYTAQLVQGILAHKQHPEQGYRSCLGLFRLGDHYGKERLEAAARRALSVSAFSYRSVKSILERGLDQAPPAETPAEPPPLNHANLRGPGYYTSQGGNTHADATNA